MESNNRNDMPAFMDTDLDPYQKNYEEDILQERTDIVGHFRIS